MYRLTTPQEKSARHAALQRAQHPDRIPVVIEPDSLFYSRLEAGAVPAAREFLNRKRFAPPGSWTVGQLVAMVREKIQLKPKYALYALVSPKIEEHVLPVTSATLEDVYQQHNDPETGMLWIVLAIESTFGA